MTSETSQIHAIFKIWQENPDELFTKIFIHHDDFAGTVFSIKNKKSFLNCFKSKDFNSVKLEKSGQRIITCYDGKVESKNCAFEIIHYHNDIQMMVDVRNCLSEMSGIPDELYSLKYKHIIFIVPGTSLVMDIADEKISESE